MLDEAVAIRDQIRALQASTLAGGRPPQIIADPGTMTNFRQAIGKSFYIMVDGTNSGSVWGTELYTHDSSIAAAAVHAGVIHLGDVRKVIKVVMKPGIPNYVGSTRNGVSSSSWSNSASYYSSFSRGTSATRSNGDNWPVIWPPWLFMRPVALFSNPLPAGPRPNWPPYGHAPNYGPPVTTYVPASTCDLLR